jgi:3D (Asp-Asp-Asp) domain-containing protein
MRFHLSRSTWLKLMALGGAVAVFVFVYEVRMFDSATVGPGDNVSEYPAPGSTLLFSATAYCKGTTTASGIRVRSGIAAADPGLLPIGSVVSIASGTRHDGIYTVLDTGPLIKGRILDFYIWSCYEALRFGRRNVEVTVLRLGWDPKASSPDPVGDVIRSRQSTRPEEPVDDPAPADVEDLPDP